MLPDTDAILAGWHFLSRRFDVVAVPSRVQIDAALVMAAECAAGLEGDEPAALFFAFARHPRAVPGAWRLLGERLARAHAASLGLSFHAEAAELATLRLDVAQRRTNCAEVKAWFRARLDLR